MTSPPAPASIGRRLLAAAYDAPVVFTLMFAGTALLLGATRGERLDGTPLSLLLRRSVLVALWAGYYGICWTRWGRTLGMRVWKQRVVRTDGRALGGLDALLRLAASLVAWAPLALGLLAASWDPERRAWHDRLSRTRVINDQ